jgi:molybdopterin converting factor subunit 1
VNHIKVLFFATLRDKAGVRSAELDIESGITIGQIKTVLVEKFPGLSGLMEHCLAAINHEYCLDETVISADSEIAFFPPVSGG